MSIRDDGRHHCDRCGADLGKGGGVAASVVVSDLNPDSPGMIRNLHFCRDREEGEGEQRRHVDGCARQLLTDEILADYLADRAATRG